MEATALLRDAIERIRALVREIAAGLDEGGFATNAGPGTNSIGWLLWHLTRVQDDHVAELAGEEQLWTAAEHCRALGFASDPGDTGYGHTAEQAAAVRIRDAALLVAYHDAVAARSLRRLDEIDGTTLDRIVDRRWDPPVTEGVRWMSIVGDCFQHAGQAAYLRGFHDAG